MYSTFEVQGKIPTALQTVCSSFMQAGIVAHYTTSESKMRIAPREILPGSKISRPLSPRLFLCLQEDLRGLETDSGNDQWVGSSAVEFADELVSEFDNSIFLGQVHFRPDPG